jgi:uncharacterized protein YecT (DUF1311 family)
VPSLINSLRAIKSHDEFKMPLPCMLFKKRVTREKIEELERLYFGRQNRRSEAAEIIKAEIVIEAPQPNLTTQAEMTQWAITVSKIAEAKMDLAFQDLRATAFHEARDDIDDAQEAWKRFAVKEAAARSAEYAGGSIRPMLSAYEYESLCIERAAALQEFKKVLNEQH